MKAVLTQEQEWYDSISVEELPTQLNANLAEIESGTGIKLAIIFYSIGISIGSTIVSFYIGYLLTLPMIIIWFIIFGIGGFEMVLSLKGESKERESYSKSGAQAEQSFSAIKIVKAFGQEGYEAEKFTKHLEATYANIQKSSCVYGLAKAMLDGIPYIIGAYIFIISGLYLLNEVKYHYSL